MTSKTRLFKELKEARRLRRARARAVRDPRADTPRCARHRQLQADTRETDIELIPDDNNIYRWVGYLKARPRSAPATDVACA
jgi:hypothetical protein